MSLAQALAAHTPNMRGPQCSVARLLESMPDDDREVTVAALADPNRWGHAALTRILRDEGYVVGRDSLSRHRKGDCACGTR